ncbi:DciA family protein [Corynebacterium camporealensis]|uniref:RNA-binding protein containing Zn ribbon n=1 Tax=Corynebacterium camporealensis TaxID=161896 RepID=A0A0F6T9V4_9CORY|nr:Protein of unknown function (DUF721) [Corynebacterium camporealensis]
MTMSDLVSQVFERARELSPNPPKLVGKPRRFSMAPKPVEPAEENKEQEADSVNDDAAVLSYLTGPRGGKPTGPDGRKQRRSIDIPSLGQQIRKEIGQRGWEHELAHGWIMGNWDNLVGEAIAAHTKPEKIKDQVVYVSCANSNWATQLRYLQRQILKKIADRLGPDVIVKLQINGPKQHRNYTGRQWVKPQGSQDTYG